MPKPRSPLATSGRGHDDGVALPVVIGVTAVVMMFLLGALGATLSNVVPARADQDAKAAVAAAQAGLDEYVSRLNVTGGGYWERGNVDPTNPAFSATGMPVPGTGSQGARFRYRLLTTQAQTAADGYLLLQVTGTSMAGAGGREVARTLTARLEPDGFLDFVYFTDVEATDPDLYKCGVQATRNGDAYRTSNGVSVYFFAAPAQVAELCSRRYYQGRTDNHYTSGPGKPYYERDSDDGEVREISTAGAGIRFSCSEIQWVGGDVVDGPLHSNDALQITGAARFADERVESSWLAGDPGRLWWGSGTPVGPTASPRGHLPRYASELTLPPGNGELLRHVLPKVDADPNTDRPGCLYRGATRIVFTGTAMQVFSPNTVDAPAHCLNTSNRGAQQTKAIPPIIHVMPTTGACAGVGYPRTNEATGHATTTDYAPCRGTAFVEGTVDGQVTVSAEDDIVITGNLRVQQRASTDVVGLVARNNVWVYHPVKNNGSNLLSSPAVSDVEAAVLSLQHSFVVQNWGYGSGLGDLRVHGAIAQKFRGPVGSRENNGTLHGYIKKYSYDRRLAVLQPPYFLEPANAPWEAVQVSDG